MQLRRPSTRRMKNQHLDVSKKKKGYPKMDGENIGKPY